MKRVILHDSSGETLMLDNVWPVGSIYMSVNSTDPGTLFGGTWQRLKDRFLLGAGDTYMAGSQGGEASHTLTENEMPAHSHFQQHQSDTSYVGIHVKNYNTGGSIQGVQPAVGTRRNNIADPSTRVSTQSSGGVCHTTTCRLTQLSICGKEPHSLRKEVLLSGRQEGAAAQQRGRQSVPADQRGSDLSSRIDLHECEQRRSRDAVWWDMAENSGHIPHGGRKHISSREHRWARESNSFSSIRCIRRSGVVFCIRSGRRDGLAEQSQLAIQRLQVHQSRISGLAQWQLEPQHCCHRKNWHEQRREHHTAISRGLRLEKDGITPERGRACG